MTNPKISDISCSDFMQALEKVAKSGIKYIHFLGGEPTVRPDFLELIEFARSEGIEVSYNTNGIRQDDELINAIFDLDVAKVTFSIDGVDSASHNAIRGKGAYAKTIQCVQRITDRKEKLGTSRPEIQVQMVLTRLWYKRVNVALDLACSLRANSVVINNLALVGSAVNVPWLSLTQEEEFEAAGELLLGMMRHPELRVRAPIRAKVIQYYREVTGLRLPVSPYECPALKNNVYIFSDGTIAPCMVAHMQGMAKGLHVPNIIETDLQDGWNFTYFDRFAHRVLADPKVVYMRQEPCNRCFFLGRICSPCPLSFNPRETPIMYPCLIAEALLAKGNELGGHRYVTSAIKADTIRTMLARTQGARPAVEI